MKPTYVLGEYAEWVVPAAVDRVVQDSWTYAAGAIPPGGDEPPVHRVIPNNGVSLVVHGRRDPVGRFRAGGIQLHDANFG